MVKQSLKFVGQSVARVDGIEKVTGQAKFLGDLAVPGMLHGKVLRSSYPHARIVSIDSSKAEALEGVAAVLTNADIADLNAIYSGRPVIAMNKVRYIGEPVAAVAAVDQATAEQAAALIEVQYEELPVAVGIDRARAPGAALIHEGRSDNICSHESVVRSDIAKVFRLPTSRVRMVISYLGGGYGSKSYTKFEPLVVALARKAKAPVRVCNSVGESMITVRRHAAQVRVKTGFKNDGTITAREAEIYLDTGAYDDNGPAVTVRAATRVIGPYRIPNILTHAYSVYTNSGSAGSFRAIGAPQVIFAGESQIDIAAGRFGIDPAELRQKNLLKRGEELRPGLKGIDADLNYGLKKLVGASQWKSVTKKKAAPVGLACAVTNAGATPVSVAMARLQSDGLVNLSAGSTEMGQ